MNNINDFLAAFFPDEQEKVFFRALKPKGAPACEANKPNMFSMSRKRVSTDGFRAHLSILNKNRGIYFVPNSGGHRDGEITRFNALFVENDKLTIAEQHAVLDECPLLTSIRVETKRSVHAYWLLAENVTAEQWRQLQVWLIDYFDADASIKNPSRLMRLPFFDHLEYDPASRDDFLRTPVRITHYTPELRYSADRFSVFHRRTPNPKIQRNSSLLIQNGQRNTELYRIGCSLKDSGLDRGQIVTELKRLNSVIVQDPLPEDEIDEIARNVVKYGRSSTTTKLERPKLDDAAYYGLAGDLVRTIDPHTEADPVGVLVQLLAGFGVLIGKTAHFRIGGDFHYLKLFLVLVGHTASGRKGTSWSEVNRVLTRVDPSFDGIVQNGLSSGEGLIFHVRDEMTVMKPKKIERLPEDEWPDELVEVTIDVGSMEKRCMVIEPEFARVLKVINREGNTLSSVIRQSWDTSKLSVMTKNPIKATDAHIGMAAHITQPELLRYLNQTETSNGFANRFLWIYVKRSKYLPDGGSLSDAMLNDVIQRLAKAAEFARATDEMKRSPAAGELWRAHYRRLSDGYQGLLGSVTSRSTAQVMRLACLYALMDLSPIVEDVHLKAALAVWKYCEDSARYIFGESFGDKVAADIIMALTGKPEGMSRTEISNHFKRNRTSREINHALEYLRGLDRIEMRRVEGSGRTAEVFTLCPELNETNEIITPREHDHNSCDSFSSSTKTVLPPGQGCCVQCRRQGHLDCRGLCIFCEDEQGGAK